MSHRVASSRWLAIFRSLVKSARDSKSFHCCKAEANIDLSTSSELPSPCLALHSKENLEIELEVPQPVAYYNPFQIYQGCADFAWYVASYRSFEQLRWNDLDSWMQACCIKLFDIGFRERFYRHAPVQIYQQRWGSELSLPRFQLGVPLLRGRHCLTIMKWNFWYTGKIKPFL